MQRFAMALFCLLISLASFASAKGPGFDVVFDLDWTLFYPVSSAVDDKTVTLPEGFFRMSDGAAEALLLLHRSGHRISLFSGGTEARNRGLADALLAAIAAKGGSDFQFHRILNNADLTRRPGSPDSARFGDKWMKDLRKINSDLSRVILVEDSVKFTMPGQERNLYWLDKTYNFQRTFPALGASDGFDAPTFEEWHRERRKIMTFVMEFMESLRTTSENPLEALQKTRRVRACRNLFTAL